MIQKFLSKYGLSVHLAVLAALPLALTPFLTAATLGSVTLWLSALAAVWLFTEPSLRRGEHISSSRARLFRELVRDPFLWFLLLALIYVAVRGLNTGLVLAWSPEASAWAVSDPLWSGFPASVAGKGYLPFCVLLASALVVLGLRNAVGAAARLMFGVVGSFAAGLGGLVATALACGDVKAFADATRPAFAAAPFWASSFGVWLVLALVSGPAAEAKKWHSARFLYILGVAGNLCALVFFAPPLVAFLWIFLALAAFAYALVYVSRTSTMRAVTRSAALAVFGMAVPVILVMMCETTDFVRFRLTSLQPSVCLSESWQETAAALTRIARAMWQGHPWTGVGEGAFALHLPFLAEQAEWSALPLKPRFASNGWMMLLAERGIFGALVLAVGLGLQVAAYALRLAGGFRRHKKQDEGGFFLFAVLPAAWVMPFCLLPFVVEMFFSPVLTSPTVVLAAVVPLALAAASFPKEKAASDKAVVSRTAADTTTNTSEK